MSKKRLKAEDVKSMIARGAAAKIAPVVERMKNLEEMLAGIQATLKAIQARLNIVPDDPELENDPIAEIARHPLAKTVNPLVFPDNRRAVERVFAKRGWKDDDTVESVLKEATGG